MVEPNVPQRSMADYYKIEIMPECSCGRDKVIYFCKKKDCALNKTQPLYCKECADDDDGIHDHKVFSINKEIESIRPSWNALKDEYNTLLTKATKIQEPHKSLIEMCERLMISAPRNQVTQFKTLTLDLKNLTKACEDF
jgi:hypothetical protein